jgi:hypothetical protein
MIKKNTMTLLFAQFWGRTIVLPTGSADVFAAVLVQGVVNHHEYLETLGNQDFHQDPEEVAG